MPGVQGRQGAEGPRGALVVPDKRHPRVVVYTTDRCGWCERAKSLLASRGIPFREEWIPRTPEGNARLVELVPGARSFPQIVIDGEPIGGFHDLLERDRDGRLSHFADEWR